MVGFAPRGGAEPRDPLPICVGPPFLSRTCGTQHPLCLQPSRGMARVVRPDPVCVVCEGVAVVSS